MFIVIPMGFQHITFTQLILDDGQKIDNKYKFNWHPCEKATIPCLIMYEQCVFEMICQIATAAAVAAYTRKFDILQTVSCTHII